MERNHISTTEEQAHQQSERAWTEATAGQALLRGRPLLRLGLGLLSLFGLITAVVLLLNPLVLDIPITSELQEINYGAFGWLMVAISAPGYAPWNLIIPVVLVGGLLLWRRFAEAAFLLLAVGASGSAVLVKALVQRARPSADLVHVVQNLNSYSFPKGSRAGS